MKKNNLAALDFIIDKLTNSIENALTGEVFDTHVIQLSSKDYRQIVKSDWDFDWHRELNNPLKKIYKLTTANNPSVIQGLISIEDKEDHIFMHLIESANFNRGRSKLYLGVPGNLVAFACKISFDRGYDGYVSFIAKTALVEHYQKTLGAKLLYGNRMAVYSREGLTLIEKYFEK